LVPPVHADAHDLEAVARVAFVECLEGRDLLAAWPAPGRPHVEEDDVTAEIGEVDGITGEIDRPVAGGRPADLHPTALHLLAPRHRKRGEQYGHKQSSASHRSELPC